MVTPGRTTALATVAVVLICCILVMGSVFMFHSFTREFIDIMASEGKFRRKASLSLAAPVTTFTPRD